VESDVRALRVLLGKCGLAQPSGWLPFTPNAQVPYNVTTSGLVLFACSVPRAFTVKTWGQGFYVATTNGASNYWTIALQKGGGGAISSFTTASYSANTWNRRAESNIEVPLTTADAWIRVYTAKTGSPGALFLAGPAVSVV
jgi:hypothetical protein